VATLQAKAGGPAPWAPSLNDVLVTGTVVAALVVTYASSFRWLVDQWNRDPNYSYGFFVIPIAAVIFWTRRGMLDRSKMVPRWWGFLPLLAVVALRYPLYEWNEQFVETATLPVVAAGLALALGGWHLLRVALPSIVFLFFMLPLPGSINMMLAGPLQKMATVGSVALLQMFGLPVMSEGNVIVIGATPLEVARACNGLSMLLSFVTLIAATVILVERPMLERVILMISAIPIALVSNILRITATAICYHRLGAEAGDKIAHDLAGWAMMPIALGLVWLELRVLSWLFVDVEEVDARSLIRNRKRRSRREVS
jgi:exosortase